VLFESRQDRAARAAFIQARALIPEGNDKAAGLRRTVDSFLHALDQRSGWHGSFAIGASRGTNINQSSGSYTCLLAIETACLVDRKLPDPITAPGINFEGTLSRRWALPGHGGLLARALTYGDIYPGYHSYDQSAVSLQLGYDRRGATSGWTLSPGTDLGFLGGRLLYATWGLRAEGFAQITGHTAIRLEVTGRHFDYPSALYADYSGNQGEAYLTLWQSLSPRWTLFGGPKSWSGRGLAGQCLCPDGAARGSRRVAGLHRHGQRRRGAPLARLSRVQRPAGGQAPRYGRHADRHLAADAMETGRSGPRTLSSGQPRAQLDRLALLLSENHHGIAVDPCFLKRVPT
jgi:hypothetical protein